MKWLINIYDRFILALVYIVFYPLPVLYTFLVFSFWLAVYTNQPILFLALALGIETLIITMLNT